jgi:hypothetical protein
VDATITLIRRLLRGARVWEAHREHYYQRLVLAGWGHRKTVFAEYGLMLVCGAMAIFYVRFGEVGRLTALSACLLMYCVVVCSVGAVEAHHMERHEHPV